MTYVSLTHGQKDVAEAYLDGAQIEMRYLSNPDHGWWNLGPFPVDPSTWKWHRYEYRVKNPNQEERR